MDLKLVELSMNDKDLLFDMMDEWVASGEKIIPSAIAVQDHHDFPAYLKSLCRDREAGGKVPETTYFCLDCGRNIFVGAVTIRHYLTEQLYGSGHIGDGIRPSERGKGYATAMIALALREAKGLGINRVLMCCDKRNIASAKSILKNGGVLENEVEVNGVIKQRYWIDNKAE